MSHLTIYVGIPARILRGQATKGKIQNAVQNILADFVENTAKEGKMKIDWYEIGGRWTGSFAAKKGAADILPSQNASFTYERLQAYHLICNDAKQGPFLSEEEEFVPADGGRMRDLDLTGISKLIHYQTYRYLRMVLDRDERLSKDVLDHWDITGDDLYTKDEEDHLLALKNGESYQEYLARLDIQFERGLLPADAFVDLKGVWHDTDEIWNGWGNNGRLYSLLSSGRNLNEVAGEELAQEFNAFLDGLKEDDYLLVVDGHAFP